jgi:hypothetical protein
VIDGIEAGVNAIDWVIKWQEMDAAKQTSQWSFDESI